MDHAYHVSNQLSLDGTRSLLGLTTGSQVTAMSKDSNEILQSLDELFSAAWTTSCPSTPPGGVPAPSWASHDPSNGRTVRFASALIPSYCKSHERDARTSQGDLAVARIEVAQGLRDAIVMSGTESREHGEAGLELLRVKRKLVLDDLTMNGDYGAAFWIKPSTAGQTQSWAGEEALGDATAASAVLFWLVPASVGTTAADDDQRQSQTSSDPPAAISKLSIQSLLAPSEDESLVNTAEHDEEMSG